MSDTTILHTLLRIRDSSTQSPIAVFRSDKPGHVNTVFAATVKTQELIRKRDPRLIGVFDGSMDEQEVRDRIEPYTLGEAA